jgi:hypothetical protein
LAFLLALTVQYGLYHRLLRDPMRARNLAEARPALALWLKIVVAWQVVVGGASVAYVALMASRHTHGVAWIAPPIGAVFGTAIPLQVAVAAIMRIGRR